jgi:hypothetical protein
VTLTFIPEFKFAVKVGDGVFKEGDMLISFFNEISFIDIELLGNEEVT